MTHKDKQLVRAVIDWAYRGTGYNGHVEKEVLDGLTRQFEQYHWDELSKKLGQQVMAMDPMAYQPNEGATYMEESRILRKQLLDHLYEHNGDSEPYVGRANYILKLLRQLDEYVESQIAK